MNTSDIQETVRVTQTFCYGGTFAVKLDGEQDCNFSFPPIPPYFCTFVLVVRNPTLLLFFRRTMMSSPFFILIPTRAHYPENLLSP